MNKQKIVVGFDGVLTNKAGYSFHNKVEAGLVEGAIDFLINASMPYDVYIYSVRSAYPSGIEAMQNWLYEECKKHSFFAKNKQAALPFVYLTLKWPTAKPQALISIDDKAYQFTGIFPNVADLRHFKPWTC